MSKIGTALLQILEEKQELGEPTIQELNIELERMVSNASKED